MADMKTVDLKALEADLWKIIGIGKELHNQTLARQEELCEKLNLGKLDEVIHGLFSKDDLLEFLSSTGIEMMTPVEKSALVHSVKQSAEAFIDLLINKCLNLDDSGDEEIKELVSKYVTLDENGEFPEGSDSELVNYITDFMDSNATHDITQRISDEGIVINGVDVKYTYKVGQLVDECMGVETQLEFKVNVSDFNRWAAEHFLVKDLGDGTAEFELVY